jgi:hypothetical protein
LIAITEILAGIFGMSYVCTMLWIIMCEANEDFLLDINYHNLY